MMHDIFLRCFNALLSASAQAVIVAMAVGAVHLLLGPRLTPRWRTILWMLVIARLIMPAVPSSRFSLFNLGRRSSPAMIAMDPNTQTVITFGIIDDSHGTTPPAHSIAPVSPVVDSPGKLDWRDIAATVWAIGFVWLMLRTVISQIKFLRRIGLLKPSHNERLTALLASSQQKFCIHAAGVLETDLVSSPALLGAIRPMLLIPTNFAERFSDSEIQSVFQHELAHARRRDLLVDWLLATVVFIHWFNPVSWLTWRRLRTERELACDEAVLREGSEIDRIQYGQTILRIFEELSVPCHTVWTASIVERGGSLRRRLTVIVQPRRSSRLRSALGLLCAAIIGCATLTSPKHSPNTSPTANAATNGNGIITREYDVRDLLTDIPDFDPDAKTPSTSRTPQQMRDRLISRIQSEIDPLSWQARGGTGTIREDSAKLIIVQSQTNQDAIWNLMEGIRARRAVQVTLETRFLRESNGMMDDWAKKNSGQWIKQDQFEIWSATINDPQVWELIRATRQVSANTSPHPTVFDPNYSRSPYLQSGSVITAPRLTLFDGQRAYLKVQTSRAYVKNMREIRSTTQLGVVSYDPEIDTVPSGITVDARTKVSEDHRSVIVTLRPELSNLVSIETSPWLDADGKKRGTIQIPHVKEVSVETTQTIPDDRTLLMRLHEVEHPTPTTHPSIDEIVYLLVRAHVIVQHETKSVSPSGPEPASTPAK